MKRTPLIRKTGLTRKSTIGKSARVVTGKGIKPRKTGNAPPHACKPPKKKTTAQLKKRLWSLFSEYIRLRDCQKTTGTLEWGICCTCGERKHFKESQAGHFIQGRHNAVLFDERNVHLQCPTCNLWRHGNLIPYYEYMVKTYGPEVIEELKLKDMEIKNFKAWELEELITDVKKKIEYLKSL